MAQLASSFAAGLIFGMGLLISQLANPAKVLAFLDVFGTWDPSLAFVMAGAVLVSWLAYLVAKRREAPLLACRLDLPTRRDVDPRLLSGAALFGVGWGLVGLCPGPALTILLIRPVQAGLFVAAMIGGMRLFHLVLEERAQASASVAPS
jgi:uncharacterized membrane protein YedE/YeeE